MSFDFHISDYIKNKARIRTTHPNFQGEKASFYQGFCDGGNAIIVAIRSGELPLKALALPIEKLKEDKPRCLICFEDGEYMIWDKLSPSDPFIQKLNATHFLLIGGGDE